MRRIARTRQVSALCGVALLVAGPSVGAERAAAGSPKPTIFDASRELLTAESPAAREKTLDRLDAIGVDTVRLVAPWYWLAPDGGSPLRPILFDAADPAAYQQSNFITLDASVRGAAARGMQVLLVPSAPVPRWTTATGDWGPIEPSVTEFELFVTALGQRYSGSWCPSSCATSGPLPRVDFWSVWNEPNLPEFLQPQYRDGMAYAPVLYRELFLAARRGLRASGHGADPMLIGETASTAGSPVSTGTLQFLRALLCLDEEFRPRGECRPIAATGWAHHPYNAAQTPLSDPPEHLGMANIGRLVRALDGAWRAGATTERLPVFITEYGIMSFPDLSSGVSLRRQVEYLAISEYLAWRNPRIASIGQYLLRDDPFTFDVAFTTGLAFADGRVKPSFDAYALTLLVKRIPGHRVLVWGHLRAGRGERLVLVRVKPAHGPERPLRGVRTDEQGYFRFVSRFYRQAEWRAVVPNRTRRGEPLRGPLVRAYRFR